jgi:hypothetical protein
LLYDISLDVFDEDLSEFDKFLALNETYVHLVEFLCEGLIVEEKREELVVYKIL